MKIKDGKLVVENDSEKEILDSIDNVIRIQKSDGNWNYSEYMFGMLNGMILIESIIKGNVPEFYNKPKRWKEERWYERVINKITGKDKVIKEKDSVLLNVGEGNLVVTE